MGRDPNQEELQTKLITPDHHDYHRKGGMKTMPFIIVNEGFSKVASYGVTPNMIFYLMDVYHMEAASATIIISLWSSLSNALSIFGAVISDSYLGRFRVIVIGSFSTLLGITFLWFTTIFPQLRPSSCHAFNSGCTPPTSKPTQLAFLYSSFGLISIGSGCIFPCCIAFGADQLKHHPNPNIISSYFNWYYVSMSVSTMVSFTLMVYIQDHFGWRIGFAVPVLFMFCSTIMFLLGSALYIKVKVYQSPFSGCFQALVIAFRNRKISLRSDDRYNNAEDDGMDRVELTESLRFLNKACVIRDSNTDSSSLNPHSISTVENVEHLKSIIRIAPIWCSGILPFAIVSQTFPALQAKAMNRHITSWLEIPAGSFSMFMILTLTIWTVFYDRILVPFLAKRTHHPQGLHPKTRIGIGMVTTVGSMVVSAIVETIRRGSAKLNKKSNMSAMWLVPQFAMFGLTEAFVMIGQIEFFYTELPQSMSSVVMAMMMLSMAISQLIGSLVVDVVDSVTSKDGRISWLSNDINEGHIDYYYGLLGFLGLLNFLFFLICCRVHRNFSP